MRRMGGGTTKAMHYLLDHFINLVKIKKRIYIETLRLTGCSAVNGVQYDTT